MKWRLLIAIARVSAVTTAAIALPAGVAAGSASTAAFARPAVLQTAATVHFSPNVAGTLEAVSCLGKSFCIGVGNPGFGPGATFSQIWNGKTWQTVPVPSPGLSYSLAGVSCFSAMNCLAVGSSALDHGQVSDAWNGKTWRMLPVLAGLGFPELTGVACPAASYCVAVGVSRTSDTPIAELWNGKAWSQLAPVEPADAGLAMLNGISCAGTANCMAVGQAEIVDGGIPSFQPLAESWNGKAWTLLPSPAVPIGLSAVSCPTASVCVAVGAGPLPASSIVSAVWNGSSWTTLKTPGPVPVHGGLFKPNLTGVSCTSATSCMAVGPGPANVGIRPFAERWSGGSSWHLVLMPNPSSDVLAGISCSGPARCMAVGGGSGLSAFTSFAVAWDGKSWRVLRTGQVDQLMGVSCASVSHCLITGGYLDPADVTRTLAESWNGRTVRLLSPHGLRGLLDVVSCLSTTFCMAADGSTTATWNGKRWAWSDTGTGISISMLSCASKRFCAAGTSPVWQGFSYGEIWNGKKWREVRFARVASLNSTATTSVTALSCPRPRFCMGTGSWEEIVDPPLNTIEIFPVAEVWNGSRWRVISSPTSASQQGLLNLVSCFSSTNCTTTGLTFDSADFPHLFAARWNGRTWQVHKLPGQALPPSGFVGPTGLSCPTATSCLAVASYFPGGVATDVAFAWNGRTWRLIKTMRPGGITSVSCAAANQCVATGDPGIRTLAKLWNGRRWRLIKTINP